MKHSVGLTAAPELRGMFTTAQTRLVPRPTIRRTRDSLEGTLNQLIRQRCKKRFNAVASYPLGILVRRGLVDGRCIDIPSPSFIRHQHRSAAATPKLSSCASKSGPGLHLDRRVLVSIRKTLQMAWGVLHANSICGRSMGRAPLREPPVLCGLLGRRSWKG